MDGKGTIWIPKPRTTPTIFFGCRIHATATGQKALHLGRNPTGYVMFTPEGRATFIFTAEGRRPAKTVEERAGLLNTVVAYTGAYRLEGDKWITKVEVAWNPEWVGTEQTRLFKIDDNLHVLTPWRVMPNWPTRECNAAS
jgi:hypothetical protein